MANFFKSERRGETRFAVSWDAIIEVFFSDFQGKMPVKITNFSSTGARFEADDVFIEGHQIISTHLSKLILKVIDPMVSLEAVIGVRWYNWNSQKNLYDIGVQFDEMNPKNKRILDDMIRKFQKHNDG